MKQDELTEEKIAELKQKHGAVLECCEAPNGDVIVVAKPSKPVWSRFTTHLTDEKKDRDTVFRMLVLGCLAAPTEKEASALLDEYPAMAAAIAGKIDALGGGSVESKKL